MAPARRPLVALAVADLNIRSQGRGSLCERFAEPILSVGLHSLHLHTEERPTLATKTGDKPGGPSKRQPRIGRRTRGAVDRLPSGRWRARFTTSDGRRLTATLATKADADAWLAAQATDVGRGVWVDPRRGRTTLGEYAQRWLAQRTDLRPRTRDDYEDIIRVHIAAKLGNQQMGKISPADVRSWYADSSQRPGRARKAYRVLRVILNTAVADELIVRNPCWVKAWARTTVPSAPIATVAQVAALADAVDERLRALVLLAAWCGLRRAELLALRRRHLDLLHATVRVEAAMHTLRDNSIVVGPPKTDAGRRTIAIPPHITGDMEAHLAHYVGPGPDDLVFTEVRADHSASTRWNDHGAGPGKRSACRNFGCTT